jgi:hypothetical protein
LELTTGRMDGDTKENGVRISCIIKESTPGQTDDLTKGNTPTTRSKGGDSTSGRMGKSTKATGTTASSTGRAALQTHRAKVESECGSAATDLNGCLVVSPKLKN